MRNREGKIGCRKRIGVRDVWYGEGGMGRTKKKSEGNRNVEEGRRREQ